MIRPVVEIALVLLNPCVNKMKIVLKRTNLGFTLVELLVVMAIISILAVISLANFRTSQIKARDAERKNDLRQIVNALEAYMSDHGSYPSVDAGRIVGCTCTNQICEWGGSLNREFCDTSSTVYMKELPDDVIAAAGGQPHYCYWTNGQSFKLYARLENENDPDCLEHDAQKKCVETARTCNSVNYDFGIASGNATP